VRKRWSMTLIRLLGAAHIFVAQFKTFLLFFSTVFHA
jgi:hypothetical protein